MIRNQTSTTVLAPPAGATISSDAPPEISPEPENRLDSHRRFIRDIVFTNIPLPVMKIRSYLWLAMLSRSLGPSGYGAWSLFHTTLDISISIASMTLGGAMMRFLSGDRTREEARLALSSVYYANLTVGGIIALLLATFSGALATILFHGSNYRVLLLAVGAILLSELVFEQTRGFLRARRLNQKWAFLTLSRLVPEMLGVIAAAAYFKAVSAPIAIYGGCSAVAAICGLIYLMKAQNFRLVSPSLAVLRRYLAFGIALVPGSLAASLSFSADKYLVGYFLGLTQVGIYSVCFTVSALGFFLVGPVNDVLLPELSALYERRDWAAFDQRFGSIQKVIFGASMCATAVLVCFPGHILRLVATDTFTKGKSALAILGMQGVFMSIVMLYEVLLKVRLRGWSSSAIWIGMGVMILAMDFLLIPRFGIVGAALSQLLSSVAGATVVIGVCWSTFRSTFRVSWAVKAGIALVILWIAVAGLVPHRWASAAPIPVLLAGACAYVCMLLVSGYTRLGELATVLKAVVR
jgi:O-antigen/teichoic acid export membrane protein